MNDIVIPKITISHLELFVVFLTFFLLLMLILVVSQNRDEIKARLTKNNIFTQTAVGIVFLLFVPALWQLASIIWQPETSGFLGEDKRGYAILLAAIIGEPFVIWRTWVAQRQAGTDEQGLITDRITKAVEQLGAEKTAWKEGLQSSQPNLEVRLGGIFALERIAQDSSRDLFTVVEILCAYIRENASVFDDSYISNNPVPRIDIQSILTVLGRRGNRGRKIELNATNLSNSNMCTIDLSGTYLQYADIDGSNFDRTDFTQSKLNCLKFRDTSIQNSNFFETDLSGAHLNWSRLNGSDLSTVIFNTETSVTKTCFDFTAIWNVDFSPVSGLT